MEFPVYQFPDVSYNKCRGTRIFSSLNYLRHLRPVTEMYLFLIDKMAVSAKNRHERWINPL